MTDDENYVAYVLLKQHIYFGPFSLDQLYFMDKDALGTLSSLAELKDDCGIFPKARTENVAKEHIDFLSKVMKLNPRDRPLAKDLLQDPWFDNID